MSKTYRRTQKRQKRDWLPNIHPYDIDGKNIFRYYYWKPNQKAIDWLQKNPHRIKDVGDYFRTYRCRCSWCLAEKRKKAIDKTHQKEILDFINGVNYNE